MMSTFLPALRRPVESAQYTSLAFGGRCKRAGVRPSMGSVGDCFDNAMAESFFSTLECELLGRYRFKTQVDARMAVFRYIEGWYNPRRRHSALGYESPMSFEKLYYDAAKPGPSQSAATAPTFVGARLLLLPSAVGAEEASDSRGVGYR